MERLTYRDKKGKAWATLKTTCTREEQMEFGRKSLERLAYFEDLEEQEIITEKRQLELATIVNNSAVNIDKYITECKKGKKTLPNAYILILNECMRLQNVAEELGMVFY